MFLKILRNNIRISPCAIGLWLRFDNESTKIKVKEPQSLKINRHKSVSEHQYYMNIANCVCQTSELLNGVAFMQIIKRVDFFISRVPSSTHNTIF